MVNPVGPVYVGGFEEFVVDDEHTGENHTILYLPDLNNDALQAEGKAPVYYWMPGSVRLAQTGDTGTYKFHHTHFVGLPDEQTTVGAAGQAEVVGGVLAFTTTSRYSTQVLKKAHDQLLAKFSGRDDRYWGTRTTATPEFRIVPITQNHTAVTSLAPGPDGTAPAEDLAPRTAERLAARRRLEARGTSNGDRTEPSNLVGRADLTRPVHHGVPRVGRGNLDAWAFRLQGQGPGSVTGGENAYAGVVGAYPSEIIWSAFHSGYSPLAVAQQMVMPMWSQEIYLKITGEWERVFQHFSAAAQGRYAWFAADVKAEFNNLRIDGGIKVEVMVDGTTPEGAELEKTIDARIDLIVQQFTQEAMKIIFVPAPSVPPAQAPSGGGLFSSLFSPYGAGLALSYRRDQQNLNLRYEETRHFRYNQSNTISSTFEGFYDEMKKDPEAEKKYFSRLALGEIQRKVTRIVKPVVNWPDPARGWVGEPVAFLSVSVGYPDSTGSIQWKSHVFQSSDTGDQSVFQPEFLQALPGEVSNPPENWDTDETLVRRKLHLRESPGVTADPTVVLVVERNEVELDPGERGILTSESVLEVRADSAGKLELGPITLDMALDDAKQVVEVEFRALGRTLDGTERPVVRFAWNHADQDKPRYYVIFTGDPTYTPLYEYRVTCTVKGSFGTRGSQWVGPWTEGTGNGSLMVRVPMPGDDGVVETKMTPRQIAETDLRPGAAPPTPAGGVTGRPPAPTSDPAPATAGKAPPTAGGAPRGRPPAEGYASGGETKAKKKGRAAKAAPPRETARHEGETGEDEVGGWVLLPDPGA